MQTTLQDRQTIEPGAVRTLKESIGNTRHPRHDPGREGPLPAALREPARKGLRSRIGLGLECSARRAGRRGSCGMSLSEPPELESVPEQQPGTLYYRRPKGQPRLRSTRALREARHQLRQPEAQPPGDNSHPKTAPTRSALSPRRIRDRPCTGAGGPRWPISCAFRPAAFRAARSGSISPRRRAA